MAMTLEHLADSSVLDMGDTEDVLVTLQTLLWARALPSPPNALT